VAQKKERKKHPILTLLAILLTEAGLVFLLIPKPSIVASTAHEKKMVAQYLGADTAKQIKGTADNWYRDCFIKTGMLNATYDYFVTHWQSRPGDIKFNDQGIGAKFDQRLDVFWLALYLAFYRFALLAAWVPYLAPVLVVAMVDGALQREIRKWRFSFSSPAAHRSATGMVSAVIAIVVLSPFFPWSLPPLAMPILMGVVAVALWVGMANIQKRV